MRFSKHVQTICQSSGCKYFAQSFNSLRFLQRREVDIYPIGLLYPQKEKLTVSPEKSSLQVIAGSTYLQEQEDEYRFHKEVLAWPIAILWAIVVCIGVLQFFFALWGLPTLPFWVLAILLALTLATPMFFPVLDTLQNKEKNFADGRGGEEKIALLLAEHLGPEWTLYRNLLLRDGKGDIDAVLVGPQGVYVLEVKAYGGEYFNEGKAWKYKHKGSWIPMKRNPTQQALWNAKRLHTHLASRGLNVFVQPRVAWTGEGYLSLSQPAAPIWYLDRPDFILQDLQKQKPLDEAMRAQITTALC